MYNKFEIKGKVIHISESKQVTEKMTTRDIVISTDDKYPQLIKFQAINNKTSTLDNLNIDQDVTVSFSLAGRESKGNYFTNLNIIDIS